MKALKKDNHYRILYIHNNKEIIAYISTKLYSKDGGLCLFINYVLKQEQDKENV